MILVPSNKTYCSFDRYSFMKPTNCGLFVPNSCKKAARLNGHFSMTLSTAREKILSALLGKYSFSFSWMSLPMRFRVVQAPYSFVATSKTACCFFSLGGIRPSSVIRPRYLPVFFLARFFSGSQTEVYLSENRIACSVSVYRIIIYITVFSITSINKYTVFSRFICAF